MPNGTDCSGILQTEALCVPTQWFVSDCTKDGRIAQWLRADICPAKSIIFTAMELANRVV